MVYDLSGEQGCWWDGDGFVAGWEEAPAVGAAFGDVEGFAGLQEAEDGQVVDAALGALREAEAGDW